MKKVVPSWWCVIKAKERLFQSRAAWRRKRGGSSSQHAERCRSEPGLRTKPMGWVLQGRLMMKAAPQWIHHPDASGACWPENDADTDVQTRDCARFKNRRPLGRKSTTIGLAVSDPRLGNAGFGAVVVAGWDSTGVRNFSGGGGVGRQVEWSWPGLVDKPLFLTWLLCGERLCIIPGAVGWSRRRSRRLDRIDR